MATELEKWPRQDLLEEVIELVTKSRNAQYGPPTQDFVRTAAMVTLAFEPILKEGARLESHHVAIFMLCLKLSRLTWSPTLRDNWTDSAGYAACGWECIVEQEKGDI